VALQPAEYRRTATIAARGGCIRAVNELKKMGCLVPWVKIDPAMKQTYGVRSRRDSRWAGNQVGEGSND
jgi:hypothetical protein